MVNLEGEVCSTCSTASLTFCSSAIASIPRESERMKAPVSGSRRAWRGLVVRFEEEREESGEEGGRSTPGSALISTDLC
jgi:hypothetical protein